MNPKLTLLDEFVSSALMLVLLSTILPCFAWLAACFSSWVCRLRQHLQIFVKKFAIGLYQSSSCDADFASLVPDKLFYKRKFMQSKKSLSFKFISYV